MGGYNQDQNEREIEDSVVYWNLDVLSLLKAKNRTKERGNEFFGINLDYKNNEGKRDKARK